MGARDAVVTEWSMPLHGEKINRMCSTTLGMSGNTCIHQYRFPFSRTFIQIHPPMVQTSTRLYATEWEHRGKKTVADAGEGHGGQLTPFRLGDHVILLTSES